MTDTPAPHPAQSLGASAIEVMDRIGIGQMVHTGGPKSAVAKLLKAGLIVPMGERVICQDRFGTVRAMDYAIPPPHHYAWCEYWCEQPEAQEEAATVSCET